MENWRNHKRILHGVHIAQKSVSQEFTPVAMQKIQCYDGCTRSERNLQFGQIAKNMQNVKRDSNNHPCNFWKVEGCFGLFIIATFIGFTALVAFISWLKTKNDKLDTQDGYFLAGRGLSGLVIAGSLELTNLSTEQLVGQSGQSYATNMGAMNWSVSASFALLCLALVFLPRYLKAGITTIPEFLEQRYDSTVKRIISFLFLLGYLLTYLPTVLYSGALAFNRIFNIDELLGITQFQAIAILCFGIGIIGAIYAIFGGLKAVAVSDTINGVGLLIGGFMVPILAICILGDGSFLNGIKDFVTNVPAEKFNSINPANALPPMVPWPVLFLGMTFNNLFYWCTNQSIIQRALAGKSLAHSQRGAIMTGFLKLVDPFFITICGLLAYRFFGDSLMDNTDAAYPMLVAEVIPDWLLGFFAAVLFGAILSSFNSALNSCVTLYTLDFHRPLFNQTCSDAYLVKIGKRFGTGLAVVAIVVAPFVINAPSGLYDFLQDCFGFYSMPILATVICGFYSKRIPALAPKVTMIVHVILYALAHLLPYVGINVHYLWTLSVLFIVDMGIMLLVGKLHPRATDFELEDVGAVDLTPWKYAKPVSVLCFICMLGVYWLFSPLGLAGMIG